MCPLRDFPLARTEVKSSHPQNSFLHFQLGVGWADFQPFLCPKNIPTDVCMSGYVKYLKEETVKASSEKETPKAVASEAKDAEIGFVRNFHLTWYLLTRNKLTQS